MEWFFIQKTHRDSCGTSYYTNPEEHQGISFLLQELFNDANALAAIE